MILLNWILREIVSDAFNYSDVWLTSPCNIENIKFYDIVFLYCLIHDTNIMGDSVLELSIVNREWKWKHMILKELNKNELIKFKIVNHFISHSKLGKWSQFMCIPLTSQLLHAKTIHTSSTETNQLTLSWISSIESTS